jgi:hypothetical protein
MLIAGILIERKVHLLTNSRELTSFIKNYVALNIEGLDPAEIDVNFIATDLCKNLDSAFNTKFLVNRLDADTGEPVDDLSVLAMLEVCSPYDVPSTGVH